MKKFAIFALSGSEQTWNAKGNFLGFELAEKLDDLNLAAHIECDCEMKCGNCGEEVCDCECSETEEEQEENWYHECECESWAVEVDMDVVEYDYYAEEYYTEKEYEKKKLDDLEMKEGSLATRVARIRKEVQDRMQNLETLEVNLLRQTELKEKAAARYKERWGEE